MMLEDLMQVKNDSPNSLDNHWINDDINEESV